MSLRRHLDAATERLAGAGVPSPRADALALAGHVLGLDRGEVERSSVLGHDLEPEHRERFEALVAERADRVPLQHLTGTAPFRGIELQVGPGVFVPRPETETVAGLAIAEAAALSAPTVIDLCTGSGAIALAVAAEVPQARVSAVELGELALAWARRNVEVTGLEVELIAGDATAPLAELAGLEGAADVVVANPPYIPTTMVPTEPEVADHDPDLALYGGSDDGLAVPLAVAARAAGLLRPGGLLVMEHADVQGESLPAALRRAGWVEVVDHPDLLGRPRAVTARAGGAAPAPSARREGRREAPRGS